MFLRFSATAWIEQTRPREGASPRSPVAELGTAPVMRRGQRRAAVWVGRAATARPREAEWSSRLAGVFLGCCNKNIFKDPFGHPYDDYHYQGALYNDTLFTRYEDTYFSLFYQNRMIQVRIIADFGDKKTFNYNMPSCTKIS